MMIEELLNDPESREALSWLRSGPPGSRTLGEATDTEASLVLVLELYSRGATTVTAVEIDKYDSGEENTGKVIVSLPGDPEARERVLDYCGELAQRRGYDPEADVDQEHVFVMLD